MNGKQAGSVGILAVGAALFAGCLTAFAHQGGTQAIAAGGTVDLSQITNLLGMLLGGGMALTGGGLLTFLKSKLPPEVGPLVDGLAGRLQRNQQIDGPLVATVVGLQAMRNYFAECDEADAHLDALAKLAWEVDSERAAKVQPRKGP